MAFIGLATISVAFFTYFLYVLFKFMKIRKIVDKIPGPRAYFLTGNVHSFKWDSVGFYEQAISLSTVYRKPRLIRGWLGLHPYVVIFGAAEAEAILSSTKPAHIIKGKFDGICGNNEKTRLNVYPYITKCALDVICQTAMGKHANTQENAESEFVKAIYKMNEITHDRQKKPWLHPKILFNLIGRGKEQARALKIIHDFGDKILEERQEEFLEKHQSDESVTIEGKRRHKAFLDLLLEMQAKGELTAEEVKNEVNTFMFEGHDTTTAGMNWALHLIGSHPEIQEKIHQELDSVFGDDNRDIDNEDLKNLTYLDRCIKEALRLYPSVPLATRRLAENIKISGYDIPAGTHILVFSPGVHRDRVHWPDPEIFDPDRFLPENVVNRHPFAYIPFAGGLRNCIGQRFALMEEKTVLAWILRVYRVKSLQARHQMKPSAELVLRPSRGVLVQLEKRKEAVFK